MTIELSIDDQSRLRLVIDPDVNRREIPGIASSPAQLLPQQKWPYAPLNEVQPMPTLPGLQRLRSLREMRAQAQALSDSKPDESMKPAPRPSEPDSEVTANLAVAPPADDSPEGGDGDTKGGAA